MRDSLLIKTLEARGYVVLPKKRIRRVGVQHMEHAPAEDTFGAEGFEDYIKRRLSHELAHHIGGALQVTKDAERHVYTMAVDFVVPEPAVVTPEKEYA